MTRPLLSRLKAALRPLVQRPAYVQAAALCLRPAPGGGGVEVLLVSSLNSGRWIVPKGWPMPARSLAEAAAQEAWEEAGVQGALHPESLGHFTYRKLVRGGIPVICRCEVFRIDVSHLADDWPEKSRRKRRWKSPEAAAKRVREPELKALLRGLKTTPRTAPDTTPL